MRAYKRRELSAISPCASYIGVPLELPCLVTSVVLGGTVRAPSPVWIEWSIVGDGTAAPEYIRRIKALGYLLEEAGDPALRLPVCYGIFDDLGYEVQFGARRIGYVFGFQYSRPTDAHSLSRGPLANSELKYYYYPSADKGFTRRIDLYSLGVVLCGIGRWGLVGSTISDRGRRIMVDRAAWCNYLLTNDDDDDDGADDEGFFEQQYFEKAIQPLSACSA
ncbi:hypothetical protein CIB48_g5458 [Xylaria polymorpha]|nr:hypothetical protein CIB48_g5458 [Xylaria polymorpha]